jgi:hypothetical protein
MTMTEPVGHGQAEDELALQLITSLDGHIDAALEPCRERDSFPCPHCLAKHVVEETPDAGALLVALVFERINTAIVYGSVTDAT